MNIRMTCTALALAAVTATFLGFASATPSQDSRPAAPKNAAPAVNLQPVTVIAIRHAEKGNDDPRDPGLSEAGEARAQTLATMLLHSGVTHIYSTNYKRTQMTVASLAAGTGVAIETYDPQDLEVLAQTIRDLPAGAVAVVSGHSNTTPGVVAALGGEAKNLATFRGMDVLGEDEYNRIFLVTLPHAKSKAPVSTLELRYGAASE